MARWDIRREGNGCSVLLDERNHGNKYLDPDDARELRDLLLREFPVEQPRHDADERCRRCGAYPKVLGEDCPGSPAAQPAEVQQQEPDPDEVRRALSATWESVSEAPALIRAAARAWLRAREQPERRCCATFQSIVSGSWMCELPVGHAGPHGAPSVNRIEGCRDCAATAAKQPPAPAPALSIEQVIAACGGDRRVVVTPDEGAPDEGAWHAFTQRWTGACGWRALEHGYGNTPEAAIQALYDQAIARLKQQRADADEALRKLGVAL